MGCFIMLPTCLQSHTVSFELFMWPGHGPEAPAEAAPEPGQLGATGHACHVCDYHS